jgi:glycosyltransferase involved in cell wall biosynthesis
MTASVSLIIPTRERAAYLEYAIRTCTENPQPNLEILVLNNASTDHTDTVMQRITDPRVRYVRNDTRLSMRDNFEKGLSLARGDILCFIGDDDGVFPNAVETALALFETHQVDAVSAARAHYFWPDLLAARRNTALLPRAKGVTIHHSQTALRRVLSDRDYYRLPCLYHGFVKRDVVERVKQKQGRFFLSSQVDMYSAIALSMEGIAYAYSHAPLVINGASRRSNGASHFGGGAQQEKTLWQQEDDMGFLPGFENCLTVGALIIESALRYARAHHHSSVTELLDACSVQRALAAEQAARQAAQPTAEPEAFEKIYSSMALTPPKSLRAPLRLVQTCAQKTRLLQAFLKTKPLNMASQGITDVHAAAMQLQQTLNHNQAGIFSGLSEQIAMALKMSRKSVHV